MVKPEFWKVANFVDQRLGRLEGVRRSSSSWHVDDWRRSEGPVNKRSS